MKLLHTITGILLLFSLSACSGWNKEKCQNTNWDALGYGEGAQGRANAAGTYAQRCEKNGVKINTDDYLKGYNRGLSQFCSYDSGYQHAFSATSVLSMCSSFGKYKEGYAKGRKDFCTYDNGFKRGSEGKSEGSICTVAEQKTYSAAYKKGRQIFLKKEVKALKEDLGYANSDLNKVRDDIADKQYQLERIPKHSNEHSVIRLRADLEGEIESLFAERDNIRNKIEQMERLLKSHERELD